MVGADSVLAFDKNLSTNEYRFSPDEILVCVVD
jgi:hypothetical protein